MADEEKLIGHGGPAHVPWDKLYKYRTNEGRLMHVWAEDGVVLLEYQDDGELKAFTQRDVRDRFRALFEMADGMVHEATGSADQGDKWQKEKGNKALELAEVLRKALADAKAQGDPTSADIRKHLARERTRSFLAVPNARVLKAALAGGGRALPPFLYPPN